MQSLCSLASSDPEVGHQMEQRCQKKAAALWRNIQRLLWETVSRANAYHTNKNNKANNSHSLQGDTHNASTKGLSQTTTKLLNLQIIILIENNYHSKNLIVQSSTFS